MGDEEPANKADLYWDYRIDPPDGLQGLVS